MANALVKTSFLEFQNRSYQMCLIRKAAFTINPHSPKGGNETNLETTVIMQNQTAFKLKSASSAPNDSFQSRSV